MPTILSLYNDNHETLELQWLAGQDCACRTFLPEICRATADLVGHLNLIHPSRIQVFGPEEMAFYLRLGHLGRSKVLAEMVNGKTPAMILADGITAPPELKKACQEHHIPLFSSSATAAEIIDNLRIYLGKKLAATTGIHGVFMDVLGLGVLISGESGIGKSELALELITRGHGLIADDMVEFSKIAPNFIEGRCPSLLQNLLEVRGIGLLDIKAIFGESSVRRKMHLKLIVHLQRNPDHAHFERLPLGDNTTDILGVPITKVIIPVAAGRNLAVLVEAAVRNTILRMRGIDTLGDFMKRQAQAMEQGDI